MSSSARLKLLGVQFSECNALSRFPIDLVPTTVHDLLTVHRYEYFERNATYSCATNKIAKTWSNQITNYTNNINKISLY